MADELRERIEALRPWPEGERLIQSLLDLEATTSAALARSEPPERLDVDSIIAAALAHRGDYPVHDRIEPERYRLAADISRALNDAGYTLARLARSESPSPGTTTHCPLHGVHEHAFRGPHIFREWEPGESPSPEGFHNHDVPGVGTLWWDAAGKIVGGPEDG